MIGTHLIIDMYGLEPEAIADASIVKFTMEDAIKQSNMTLLNIYAKQFPSIDDNEFGGCTVVAVLAESHFSAHTYPEFISEEGYAGYIAFDIFTCGDKAKPHDALEVLVEAFNPRRYKLITVDRGL